MKNLFQEKFDDFEDEPDRDVWAAIEVQLRPKQAGIFAYRKYMWAAAASVAMLFGIGYFSIYLPKNQRVEVAQESVKVPQNEAIVSPEKTETSEVVANETTTSTPAQTVAKEVVSPTKATQSVKRIKTADGRTLIEKTETYIVTEKKTYEVEPETKKEVQVAQSMEKQPVQSPTLVTPDEIKPATSEVVAAAAQAESKNEPWKVYNVPAQSANPTTKSMKAAPKRQSNNTQLDLNHANPVQLVSFASQQLNKVANTPVKVNYKEDKNTNQIKYEIGFKDFKIVRKVGKK